MLCDTHKFLINSNLKKKVKKCGYIRIFLYFAVFGQFFNQHIVFNIIVCAKYGYYK